MVIESTAIERPLGDDMVSIIVPVYNVVKYIDRCITSILCQTYKDIEAILIDDCSDDGTSEILDRYALEDSRITIVHQCARGGVSRARNIGLSKAHGEYIMFVDSDDWIDDDIVEKCVNNFQTGKLNYFGRRNILPNGKIKEFHLEPANFDKERIIANSISTLRSDKKYFDGTSRVVWGKLFEKTIIEKNNIRFKEGLQIGEDGIFLMQYCSCIDGCNLISSIGYNYNKTNAQSLTHNYNPERLKHACLDYELTKAALRGMPICYRQSGAICCSIINYFFSKTEELLMFSLKAAIHKSIPFRKCFSDPVAFLNKYKHEIKEMKIDNTSYISSRFKLAYRFISLPSTILVLYLLSTRIVKKVYKILFKSDI